MNDCFRRTFRPTVLGRKREFAGRQVCGRHQPFVGGGIGESPNPRLHLRTVGEIGSQQVTWRCPIGTGGGFEPEALAAWSRNSRWSTSEYAPRPSLTNRRRFKDGEQVPFELVERLGLLDQVVMALIVLLLHTGRSAVRKKLRSDLPWHAQGL